MDLPTLLKIAVEKGASDIHITVNRPPMMRYLGEIVPITDNLPNLTGENTKMLIYSFLYDEQKRRLEENMELDSSFSLSGVARFRLNVLYTKNGLEAVLRVIPSKIPKPEELDLMPSIVQLSNLPRGLVLVTGPTGSGKSTTLACLLNLINENRKGHILTIEDPIEFVYESKKSVVRQREIGQHTKSFNDALRAALREDPNVILVGEMRDLETIQLTLTAAETGHLTFATLHTQDAPSTVDRIIDVFPSHQQTQIRIQLSTCLQAVVSQILLPKIDGTGRVAAREVMIMTPAISNLIRESKTHMIYNAIETGAKFGMISMDKSLANLVIEKKVEKEVAASKAHDKETFTKLCQMI